MSVGSFHDWLASRYDGLFKRPRDLAENAEIKRRLLRSGISGFVTDLGCGTGFFLELIRVGINFYEGFDISEQMLKQARAKFPYYTFAQMDMHRVSTASGSSDAAVLLWSLNYARDPGIVIREVQRLLEPGGLVFACCYADWGSDESPLPYETAEDYPRATRRHFTRGYLLKLFSDFDNVEIQGMSARFMPSWLSARFMRLESETIGRWTPERCYYMTVSGRKRA